MRRRLIQIVLPVLLCVLPLLAAAAVASAIEVPAREFYLHNLRPMDGLILAIGLCLFLLQSILALKALRWRGTGFDERSDAFLSGLAQAAEWFPLLGLLGTVAAILQTFSSMSDTVTPREIIRSYSPAITATGSGLFMALINIFPTWIVQVGRDLIRRLGGTDEPVPPEPQPLPVATPAPAPVRRPHSADAGS